MELSYKTGLALLKIKICILSIILGYLRLNVILQLLFSMSFFSFILNLTNIILKINSDSQAKTYVNVSTPQAFVLILSSTQDVTLFSAWFYNQPVTF